MLLFTKMENKQVVDNVKDLFAWYCGRMVLSLGEAFSKEFGIELFEDKYEFDIEPGYRTYCHNANISFSVPKALVDRNGIFLHRLEELVKEDQVKNISGIQAYSFRNTNNERRADKESIQSMSDVIDKYWSPDVDSITINVFFKPGFDKVIKSLYDKVQKDKESLKP